MISVKALSAENPLYRLDFRWGVYDDELHQAVAYFYDEGPARVSAVVLSAIGLDIHPDQVKAVQSYYSKPPFNLAGDLGKVGDCCPVCGGPLVAFDHPEGSWASCSECGLQGWISGG